MEFLGITWSRPLGLLALLVPLALLILARRSRPESEATGTLSVWREIVDPDAARGARRRWRVTPGMACLIAALALGAVALAGPRTERAPARTWRLVLDRSPSMFLPLEGGTRMQRALEAAEAWLSADGRDGDRVLWAAWDGAALETFRGARPPASWTTAGSVHSAPPTRAIDREDTLLVTDAAPPAPGLERAGVVASGGQAVPGPVGVGPDALIVWNGTDLEAGGPVPVRSVAVDAELPADLVRLIGSWAAVRGLRVVAEADAATALEVSVPDRGERATLAAQRDGWSVSGRARAVRASDPPQARPEIWLGAGDRPVVGAGTGRLEIGFSTLELISGDPAAFAVSWASLFDRCLAPPPGVVPLEERLDAGPASVRGPAVAGAALRGPASGLDGSLAGIALALTLAALCLRV